MAWSGQAVSPHFIRSDFCTRSQYPHTLQQDRLAGLQAFVDNILPAAGYWPHCNFGGSQGAVLSYYVHKFLALQLEGRFLRNDNYIRLVGINADGSAIAASEQAGAIREACPDVV